MMREIAFVGKVPCMRCLTLAVLFAGCTSPQYQAYLEEHADDTSHANDASTAEMSSGGVAPTSTGDAEPASTGAVGSESAGVSATDTADMTDTASTSGSGTDTGDAIDTANPPPVEKPMIVSVELPANVYAAGPVPLAVQAEHTEIVRVTLDGADAGELIAAGGGLFTGALPVRGAIDNGPHEVEVIAQQGEFEDSRPAGYTVSTPKPGTEAWSQSGPTGSRTNRVAVTPAGDLIEVGQTVIGGVPRPTIRKRSGVTGAELWPEKTITLDTREGAVVDVAVLPDGRMWVAMNVNAPNKAPQPRIALLDADGHALGIEAQGTAGRVVRALAADASGGCFAVGVAGVMGDWDFAFWRVTAVGVQTLGDTLDYVKPKSLPHSFADIANDVVIDGDVAWIGGMSNGKHDADAAPKYLRGILVPMNLHTGNPAGPVIVAPPLGGWPQSAFVGAALDPEGVLVTGYGCDEACSTYRIETSRYTVDGMRTWFQHEGNNAGLAYGSDVARDSQGRALVAGAVTQNGKLRGRVFGRTIGLLGPVLFDHWYPGVGPSEALGIARDSFDRILPAGYMTVNGETQARITLIHG
jgi:hypothetical protein